MTARTTWLNHLALLLLLFVLAGCSGPGSKDSGAEVSAGPPDGVPTQFDADGDGYSTMDEYVAAVEAMFPTYRWPENYIPTLGTMLQSLENAPPGEHLFQAGGEDTKLGLWNECAWQRAWLDAFRNGDVAAQEEALQMLRNLIPVVTSPGDPAAIASQTGVLDAAALGDPSQIARYVEAEYGCGDLVFDGP